MKKILIIFSLLLTVSCSHANQTAKLNLSFDSKKSDIGNGRKVRILVIDDRSNKEIIGSKEFGDEKIEIKLDQNLAEFLQKKITENLMEKGFKIGDEKIVEIHLKKMKYKAEREFVIGKSKASGEISLIIKNSKTKAEFSKDYNLSMKKKHFIVPLESTDAKIINSLLEEMVEDILDDKKFLENLTK
jgi:uncharacterized lipoprotein YajG